MKILLTGCSGQVGAELIFKLSALGDVVATNREQLDLSNPNEIRIFLDQVKPDIIINTAAFTDVDSAEAEDHLSYQINKIAPQVFAEKANQLNIPLVHFSTDYVFDGLKAEAYSESDIANPLSTYGKSKYEGEKEVRLHPKHIILRTSWVFSKHGKNFLKSIFNLIQNKKSLSVVSDQIGAPTSASMLSDVTFKIVSLILKDKNFAGFGTYHVACDGEASWYSYACFISREAIKLGVKVECTPAQIQPISSVDYSSIAIRPLNSRLNCKKLKKTFMLELPKWEDEVKKVLGEIIQIK
jgi:dTDP-4-dehydrorhamnose reductase